MKIYCVWYQRECNFSLRHARSCPRPGSCRRENAEMSTSSLESSSIRWTASSSPTITLTNNFVPFLTTTRLSDSTNPALSPRNNGSDFASQPRRKSSASTAQRTTERATIKDKWCVVASCSKVVELLAVLAWHNRESLVVMVGQPQPSAETKQSRHGQYTALPRSWELTLNQANSAFLLDIPSLQTLSTTIERKCTTKHYPRNHHFEMFPRQQQESREIFNRRSSLLPPRLPRLHSYQEDLDTSDSLENHSEETRRHHNSSPDHHLLHDRPRGRSLEEEQVRLHTVLPSVASLMPPNRELRHENSFDTDARQQLHHLPEVSYERRRDQTIPASSAALTTSMTTVSSRREVPAPLAGLSAFGDPQLIGMRSSRFGASPSNRASRWSPYAPVSISTGVGEPSTIPWDDTENEGAKPNNRRRRTSPRRRLAASKARAQALQMTIEGEQLGLVGRFETLHAGYRERNYGTTPPLFQSPATPFGFSLLRPPAPDESNTSPKGSRYLREMDRRSILARLDQGEKQSALAKEFRVTRAAICNLNKHRDNVLSRQHEDPLAKHPKKARHKQETENDTETALSHRNGLNRVSLLLSDASPTHYEDSTVHLVAAQPAERLILLLLSNDTSDAAFRHNCDRLMTLVVEEVLTHTETSNTSHPCGISITPGGSPMLSVFQTLEPELPTGQIQLRLSQFGSVVDLPDAVASHSVCLFYAFTDAEGGVRVAKGIRELLNRGAVEELLCLVTLAVSALTIEELQRAHPRLRIAAAHVEKDDEWLHQTEGLENEPNNSYETFRSSRLQLLATRAAEIYKY